MRIGVLLLMLCGGLGLARAGDPASAPPPPLAQRWDVEKSLAGQADLIVVGAVVPAQSDLKARRLTLKVTQMLAGQQRDAVVFRYGPLQEEYLAPFLKGKPALYYLQRARDTYIPVTVPGQIGILPAEAAAGVRDLADAFPLQVTLQPITGPMYANATNNLFVKVTNRGTVLVKLVEVEVHGVFTEPEMEERVPLRTDDDLEMDLFGNVPHAPVLRPGASVVVPLKVPCLLPEGWAGLEPGTQTTSPARVRAVVKVQEGLPDIFDTPRPVYRAASAWMDITLAGTIPPQPAR